MYSQLPVHLSCLECTEGGLCRSDQVIGQDNNWRWQKHHVNVCLIFSCVLQKRNYRVLVRVCVCVFMFPCFRVFAG